MFRVGHKNPRSKSSASMEMQKIPILGPHWEPPRRSKSVMNWVQMLLGMEKMKILIFDTPPLQNHHFWVLVEAKLEPPWHLKAIFTAIETDDRQAMLFRTPWETFLHLKPTAGERCVHVWAWKPNPFFFIYIYIYLSLYTYIYVYIHINIHIKTM